MLKFMIFISENKCEDDEKEDFSGCINFAQRDS